MRQYPEQFCTSSWKSLQSASDTTPFTLLHSCTSGLAVGFALPPLNIGGLKGSTLGSCSLWWSAPGRSHLQAAHSQMHPSQDLCLQIRPSSNLTNPHSRFLYSRNTRAKISNRNLVFSPEYLPFFIFPTAFNWVFALLVSQVKTLKSSVQLLFC